MKLLLALLALSILYLQVFGQGCNTGEAAFSETLIVSEDAYVSEPEPNANFGNATVLIARGSGGMLWSFIQFNLSGIPEDLRLTEATLLVPRAGTVVPGRTNVFFIKTASEFDEDTITWNNKPGFVTGDFGDTVDLAPVDQPNLETIPVDETENVSESLLAGNNTIGFGIVAVTGNTAFIDSKESGNPIRLRLAGCVPSSINCDSLRCPQGDNCCNGQCYNPATHVCIDNRLCPVNHLLCGIACYLPSAYTCFNNNFLCPRGLLRCGQACYNPDRYSCENGRLVPVNNPQTEA